MYFSDCLHLERTSGCLGGVIAARRGGHGTGNYLRAACT
jgi:hypothetical protein